MVSAIAPDPIHTGNTLIDTRHRPVASERGVLPDSAPAAARSPDAGEDERFARDRRDPPPDRKDNSAMFAAAVIAGALPPRPESLEELFLRIGTSAIPTDSEARLRDLLV
jgi:hypothetical protein